MNEKICIDCKTQKPYSEFQINRDVKDGYNRYCRGCTHIRTKKRYIKHCEKLKQIARLYYLRNREKILARQSIYAKTKAGKLKNLEAVKRYQATANGKAVIKAYLTAYNQSEHIKLVHLENVKRYQATANGKAVIKAYTESERGKAVKTAYGKSDRCKSFRAINYFRHNLLETAHKLLADMSLEANSGNEQVFLAHNSLKNTIQMLTELGKKR